MNEGIMIGHMLVIDDNNKMCNLIKVFGERKYGYNIDVANTISEAITLINSNDYKLITLDIELDNENGLVEISTLKKYFDGPILFVSCVSDAENIIKGFNKGADDYITKPFNMDELFLRIARSIERADSYVKLKIENYTIDEYKNEVYLDDRLLSLSDIATKVLILLLKNKNRVVTREQIFTEVWEANYTYSTRVIDTHISYIRKETNDIRIRSIRSSVNTFETRKI